MPAPMLYFDLGSPYAYLATERAERVLGRPVELEPVLLGAIFARRGWGSWSQTPENEARRAEIERRARAYGLPPVTWPPGWPLDGLQAMRAATWAKRQGAVDAFARAVFRRQFQRGEPVSSVDALAAAAGEAGLDGDALRAAIAEPEVKAALRAATDAAWDVGVRGIPTLRVGDAVFYGDDALDQAADRAA